MAALLALAAAPGAFADGSDAAAPRVQVIGTTLLPGSEIDLRKLPANAQVFGGGMLRRQGAANITDFLEHNANSLNLNAVQGNPYQPDLNLRGFTASPLLGTPQGLSVFVDGVRVNEPFGDTVNWDLLPASAIDSIQLVPGSNPSFGLNTLGGAVAVYTRSGASAFGQHPGATLSVSGGSFGGRAIAFEAGGATPIWDWFITGNDSQDNGWAEHNPSHVRQLFGKFGWQGADDSSLSLALQYANNTLQGTQTLPVSFPDFREAYTWPDTNGNRLGAAVLGGRTALSPAWALSGTAYYRSFRNNNVSSNVNPDYAEPGETEATNDASTIEQNGWGIAAQLTHSGSYDGLAHHLALGASIDVGRARYTQSVQDAVFTATRAALGIGDFEQETDARSTTRYDGVFVSDSIDLDPRWTLSLAARWNHAHITISDLSGNDPALNGTHDFQRLNPAIGLNFNPSRSLTTYAAYNEGMRAPTAIELGCADPEAPCKLPNSFVSDPPLQMVVSQTFEIGSRGTWGRDGNWSVAAFRTDLHDDLQFVSGNALASNTGYFQNVGTTRRQGIELGAGDRAGRLGWAIRYSGIAATYRTGFVENSPSNSTADENGSIVVTPGDRMPGIPLQGLKLRLDLQAQPQWNLGMNLVAASSVYARGNENNLDPAGRVGGFAVVNLDTRYDGSHGISLFGRVGNLFNRTYANFGVLGDNVFTGPGQTFDGANARAELFRGYGVPRSIWVGMQVALD